MSRYSRYFSTFLRIQALIFAPSVLGAELTLSVANIENADGRLMVAVLDSESAFAGEAEPVLSVLLPARAGRINFSTDALPAGEYGVRVMQDENGNGTMDNNLVGMPTEPWGFSNNAVGNFGPPGWADVRFTLGESTAIQIDLNH